MPQTYALRTLEDLKPGDHLCFLYETEEEHRAVLTPFLRQGLERGEKVVYVVDAHTAETILGYLRDDGVDVEPYLIRGQLSILTHNEAYLREGVFDPEGMIALLRTEAKRARTEGYPALRVTGEMTWTLRGLPGSERLIEYEAKLNEFFPGSQCLAICQYDRRRFAPAVLLDVLRTHPTAVIGTEVYDNFYYIPPTEVLGGDLPAVMLRYWVDHLTRYKRTEELWQESEARYRSIVEHTHSGILMVGEDFRFMYVNDELCRILGRAQEEILGHDFREFLDEESRDLVAERYRRRQAGEEVPPRYEFNVVRKDGEIRRVEIRSTVLRDAEGRVRTIAQILDITERVRATVRIDHLNAVLRAIRSVNQLIVREKDRDRLLQGACDRFIQTRGYYSAWIALMDASPRLVAAAEAGLGEKFLPIVEQLKRGKWPECARRALAQSGVVVIEDPSSTCGDCPLSDLYLDQTAMTIRLEHGGTVYGFFKASIPRDLGADEEEQGLFQEIARDLALALHSMEVEEELAQEQYLLRMLMDTIPDHIYFKDTDSRFVHINQALAEYFGLSDPAQAVGKTDFDFFTEEHAQQAYADEQEVMRSGQPVVGLEEKETWPDGRITWVSTTKVPLHDKEGHLIGTFGLSRDITEHKRMEEALRESEENFRSIFQSVPESLLTMNQLMEVLNSNEAFEKLIHTYAPKLNMSEEGLQERILSALREHLRRTKHGIIEISKSSVGKDL